MDQAEYELWKNLDIYGYSGMVAIVNDTTSNIRTWRIHKKEDRVREDVEFLERICLKLTRRIESIDETLYDNRFPVEVISALKKRAVPALREIPKRVRKSVEEDSDLSEVITYTKEETRYMQELGIRFLSEFPNYLEYRLLIPERDRQEYDKRFND